MFALKNGILHLQVKKITRNLPVFLRGTRKNKTEKVVNFLPDNTFLYFKLFFLQGQGVWKYQVFDSWCFRYLPYLLQTKINPLLICLISYYIFFIFAIFLLVRIFENAEIILQEDFYQVIAHFIWQDFHYKRQQRVS